MIAVRGSCSALFSPCADRFLRRGREPTKRKWGEGDTRRPGHTAHTVPATAAKYCGELGRFVRLLPLSARRPQRENDPQQQPTHKTPCAQHVANQASPWSPLRRVQRVSLASQPLALTTNHVPEPTLILPGNSSAYMRQNSKKSTERQVAAKEMLNSTVSHLLATPLLLHHATGATGRRLPHLLPGLHDLVHEQKLGRQNLARAGGNKKSTRREKKRQRHRECGVIRQVIAVILRSPEIRSERAAARLPRILSPLHGESML